VADTVTEAELEGDSVDVYEIETDGVLLPVLVYEMDMVFVDDQVLELLKDGDKLMDSDMEGVADGDADPVRV
jgi:hypothetical protein